MKQLSLQFKIYALSLIPFTLLTLLVLLYPIKQNYSSYQEAAYLDKEMSLIQAISFAIHETQIERGKTAGYYSGSVDYAQLEAQINVSSKKLKEVKDTIDKEPNKSELDNKILSQINNLNQLRSNAKSKSVSLGDTLGQYTALINSLLEIISIAATTTDQAEVAAKFRTLDLLEKVKESGGLLRAKMTKILSLDKPVSESEFFFYNHS